MSDTIRIYDSGVFCARIFNTSTGALLTKEEVESITYTASRLTTKSLMSGTVTRTPVEGHSNITVDKSQVFLEEAIKDNFWSIDETGYSFIHIPNTRTNQLFTEAGKYEVLYNIQLIEGNPVVLAFEVTVS